MSEQQLQIVRFGNTNNIVTRVRHILDYDFSKLDYLDLLFEVTFSECEQNTDTDTLDLSYWYQYLQTALSFFESKDAQEIVDRNEIIRSINKKLNEVHTALVHHAPEEWPEFQYLVKKEKSNPVNQDKRKPDITAEALYREIRLLLKTTPNLLIRDLWSKFEKHNDVTVDLLEQKFCRIKEQDLRMNAVRNALIFGCIEVTSLMNEKSTRKSFAYFRLIQEDGHEEEVVRLTWGTIEKRLNSMKKALKANKKK